MAQSTLNALMSTNKRNVSVLAECSDKTLEFQSEADKEGNYTQAWITGRGERISIMLNLFS